MRRLLTLALGLGACLALTGGLASNAKADTPNCVTKAEYQAVHKGYKLRRVNRIFDTAGWHKSFSGGVQIRNYHTCTQFGDVAVSYKRQGDGPWRLISKGANW